MSHPLDNPVYHALCSGDSALGARSGAVAFFEEDVSPFAGFPEGYERGFADLYDALPAKRRILFARPQKVKEHPGWELRVLVEGLQFVWEGGSSAGKSTPTLVPLQREHVPEMVALAALTKPGPFGPRTIDFGHYYGIFEKGALAAMTGQRLHPEGHSEVSAVCTHPDHVGKGFAALLVQQQLELIRAEGRIPFLHVRADNDRAIALYERLGFRVRGPMNFYFLQRAD